MIRSARPGERSAVAAIALALLVACPAFAADLFVRTAGDDSNDGRTPESAFRTIDRALRDAGAGDAVYVGAGTYAEQFVSRRSGTPGSPIRFIADVEGTRTGDRGPVIIEHRNNTAMIRGHDHIELVGFVIDGGGGTVGVVIEDAEGIEIRRCSFIDINDRFVDIRAGSKVTIDGCDMNAHCKDGIVVDQAELSLLGSTLVSTQTSGTAVNLRNNRAVVRVERSTISGWKYAFYNDNSRLDIVNTLISGAKNNGICHRNSGARTTLWHVTIADTKKDSAYLRGGTLTAHNSMFVNSKGDGIELKNQATYTGGNNLFWNNTRHSVGGGARNESDVVADPRFVDGSYHLGAGSGAIDAGADASAVTSVDRLGIERPIGGGYDIGAFEHVARIVPAVPPYAIDFESGVDHAWEARNTRSTPELSRFHGLHERDGSTTLHATLEPGQTYIVMWDLIIDGSWDGHAGKYRDYIVVELNGEEFFRETFTYREGRPQTWPVAAEARGNLGLGGKRTTLYTDVFYKFEATRVSNTITWRAIATGADERWGIDRVRLEREEEADPPVFVDVSEHSGFASASSGGLHWGDFNKDGLHDVFVGSSQPRLFLQGSLGFSSIAVSSSTMGSQCAMLDIDADGDLDLVSPRLGSSSTPTLFLNDGGGNLARQSIDGIDGSRLLYSAIAADLDHDGRGDIFLTGLSEDRVLRNAGGDPVALQADADSLAHFDDIRQRGFATRSSVADVNNDGMTDVLHHGFRALGLYLSTSDGLHDPRAVPPLTTNTYSAICQSAWGDYDNDGDLDLYVGNFRAGDPGTLWRNDLDPATGTISFTDVTPESGLGEAAAIYTAAWGDYDNDGDLDLYLGTYGTDPDDENTKNRLYENQDDGTFRRVDVGASVAGSAIDAAFIDYDNDGDLDLSIANSGSTGSHLLRNETNSTDYLKVRVIGGGAGRTNIDGIGVRVELFDNAGSFVARRDIGASSGFGAGPFVAHFGGVDPEATYTVRAHMAGGRTLEASVVPAVTQSIVGPTVLAQTHTFVEPSGGLGRIVAWSETPSTERDEESGVTLERLRSLVSPILRDLEPLP